MFQRRRLLLSMGYTNTLSCRLDWKNALSVFIALMNHIFLSYLDSFIVVFIDDVLVYSSTPNHDEEHLKIVMNMLWYNQLFAKFAKCDFWLSEVKLLGYIVSDNGILVDPIKIEVVVDWKSSSSVTKIRSFLGLDGYFWRFYWKINISPDSIDQERRFFLVEWCLWARFLGDKGKDYYHTYFDDTKEWSSFCGIYRCFTLRVGRYVDVIRESCGLYISLVVDSWDKLSYS